MNGSALTKPKLLCLNRLGEMNGSFERRYLPLGARRSSPRQVQIDVICPVTSLKETYGLCLFRFEQLAKLRLCFDHGGSISLRLESCGILSVSEFWSSVEEVENIDMKSAVHFTRVYGGCRLTFMGQYFGTMGAICEHFGTLCMNFTVVGLVGHLKWPGETRTALAALNSRSGG